MNFLINLLAKSGLLKKDLDYNLVRWSMVIIFLFFGYQKWFEYEAQTLIPFISNGPLISWMYPVFGVKGATWFLGTSEWLFGALLFAGFWNKKLGFLAVWDRSSLWNATIIPYAGRMDAPQGIPAMQGNVAFLRRIWFFWRVGLSAETGRRECRASVRRIRREAST